jgi:hypothetical protein
MTTTEPIPSPGKVGERFLTSIVVSGALANRYRNGGGAWVRLNWLLGFQRLGCKVYFVEEIGQGTCVNAAGKACSFGDSVNAGYFQQVTRQFGLGDNSTLIYEGGEQAIGLSKEELLKVAGTADLLVNISGHLSCEPFFSHFRRRAYIDIDPGYTQFWQAAGNLGARLAGHDVYFTIGENISQSGCSIPSCGIEWRPIRPPVVLGEWPATGPSKERKFTTVASWRGPYGPVQHEGKTYGLKVHEFRKFLELPRRTGQQFELALNIHPGDAKDRQALVEHGWRLVDPYQAAGDPAAFRHYVQSSGAEFSAAQGVYVETGSGWFSDRTVCYLASGKPALVQDTGFSRNYPVGEGLLAFRTLHDAVLGAERIAGDYERHSRAARALAEMFFDSDKVLRRVLEEAS